MGKTITVWNLKGGVGKTTTAINLAYNLSTAGGKVLAIDLDPQVNTTPIFVKASEHGRNICNVLENPKLIRSSIYRTKYPLIDIIKGSAALGEAYEEYMLQAALETVKEEYAYILVDCQPSCGKLARNALYAADMVLSPAILDRFCLDNLRTVSDILAGMEDTRGREIPWHVFANRVRNIKSQKKIYEELVFTCDYPLLDTCVSDSAAVPNALAKRKPLAKHAASSIAAKDFAALAEEIRGL